MSTARHSSTTEPRRSGRRGIAAFACGALAVAALGGGIFAATQSTASPVAAPSSSIGTASTTRTSTFVPSSGGAYVPAGHSSNPATPSTPSAPSKPATPVKPVTPASDPALAGAQQELTQLGYYHGPIDGQMTSATRSAISAFQSWAKGQSFGASVSVNGHFDPPTQYALNCALGGNANGPGAAA